MAVYVDKLIRCRPTPDWPHKLRCHLFADTADELHEFAGLLKLDRKHFHESEYIGCYYRLDRIGKCDALGHEAIDLSTRKTLRKRIEIWPHLAFRPKVTEV